MELDVFLRKMTRTGFLAEKWNPRSDGEVEILLRACWSLWALLC